MKLVREHIEQFTREKNPFKSLNIGKRAVIKNWFKTWAPNADYEIDADFNIHVKRSLDFRRSKITSLPDNLHIVGSLDLYKSKITSLPDNLHIEGHLDIARTDITFLPDNLHIERSLNIWGSKITSLSDNLHVDGKIFKDF